MSKILDNDKRTAFYNRYIGIECEICDLKSIVANPIPLNKEDVEKHILETEKTIYKLRKLECDILNELSEDKIGLFQNLKKKIVKEKPSCYKTMKNDIECTSCEYNEACLNHLNRNSYGTFYRPTSKPCPKPPIIKGDKE